MQLALDSETFSELSLKAVGPYRYAEESEIMLVSHAIDDGPAEVMDLTDGDHDKKLRLVAEMAGDADDIIIANSMFDRTVFAAHGVTIPVEKITDTMVLGFLHGLPGGLDMQCEVLNVPTDKAKDKAGKRLVQLFCKPRPRNMVIRRATRDTHPEDWAAFVEYARQDIPSMLAIFERMPKWNWTPEQRQLWILDQRINDRGIKVDLDLAHAALRAFDRSKLALNARTAEITEGDLKSLNQRDRFIEYADEQGLKIPNMQKATVEALLRSPDLSDDMRELLEIRQQAAAASPAKYRTAINATCKDGRIRGMFQFAGASRTIRDAGRLLQVQNLPRPTIPPEEINMAIEAMKLDCEDLIYDDVAEICVNAVRGVLVAA